MKQLTTMKIKKNKKEVDKETDNENLNIKDNYKKTEETEVNEEDEENKENKNET